MQLVCKCRVGGEVTRPPAVSFFPQGKKADSGLAGFDSQGLKEMDRLNQTIVAINSDLWIMLSFAQQL